MSTLVDTPPEIPTAGATRLYTPDDLLTMPDGGRYELVDGHLVEANVSVLSNFVSGEIAFQLRSFNQGNTLGWVLPADTLYRCYPWKPSLVRKPDVSFVRRDRLPPERLGEGFVTVAPDLVVEVISPNDLASDLSRKLVEYRRAGVRLIWVVDPLERTVRVLRADGSGQELDASAELDGEGVLPGFRCRIADLFPPGAVAVAATDQPA